MPETADEEIKNRLRSIFPDESTANKVVDLIVHRRPLGWSRKSNSPYYKESFARFYKKDIDEMIKTGMGVIYRYDIFCDEKSGGMSRTTLYLRINQSIRFLVENLDPEGIYTKWYNSVKVTRDMKRGGVCMEYANELHSDPSKLTNGELILPKKDLPRWKNSMNDWLEGTSIEPFIVDKIGLTMEDVLELRQELGQLKGIQALVSQSTIKILRINV